MNTFEENDSAGTSAASSDASVRSQAILENEQIKVAVDRQTGAVSSLLIKRNSTELVSEKALQANFRILLPLEDNASHYIDGMEQRAQSVTQSGNTIAVAFSGMTSPKGSFAIQLAYTVTLNRDHVSFKARLTNGDRHPVAEFWFPRIGGISRFGNDRSAGLATPGYHSMSKHEVRLFDSYPGSRGLGAEAAEWHTTYPGTMVMPWWDIFDNASNAGLYLGYHDPVFRMTTWHTYLVPDRSGGRDSWLTSQQAGQPVGLIFSHVRYPYIHSGEFIARVHEGDWHEGSLYYRDWFLQHFPLDETASWLRKESAWFSSILYQPEDKVVADYKTYLQWTRDAREFGINCFELIGWDKGGLERDYPDYRPEEKLGGKAGFRDLLRAIEADGGKCLVFVNYNILDQNTDWYRNELWKHKQQDSFGQQNIWMGWGEGTLLARSLMDVRYHVRSSITPEMETLLAGLFVELVEDGAHGFQIDKVCVASALDFNPLNTLKPDVALCQGLVDAIDRLSRKCVALRPPFRMASEFGCDRLLPYFDVGYRNASKHQISTLRYVFPEWTSCVHISAPRDFRAVNFSVLNGAVMCIEPDTYQGSLDHPAYREMALYIKEVNRLRRELADFIFTANYFDDTGGSVTGCDPGKSTGTGRRELEIADPGAMPEMGDGARAKDADAGGLLYKVHGNRKSGQLAIVVVNDSPNAREYHWKFGDNGQKEAVLYAPFKEARAARQGEPVAIEADGLQIIVEKR